MIRVLRSRPIRKRKQREDSGSSVDSTSTQMCPHIYLDRPRTSETRNLEEKEHFYHDTNLFQRHAIFRRAGSPRFTLRILEGRYFIIRDRIILINRSSHVHQLYILLWSCVLFDGCQRLRVQWPQSRGSLQTSRRYESITRRQEVRKGRITLRYRRSDGGVCGFDSIHSGLPRFYILPTSSGLFVPS